MSRPPETQSTATVSPEATVATGASAASKNPQWQCCGRHETVWCVAIAILLSWLGDQFPKPIRAGDRDAAAEDRGPIRLVAELVAPRPQPAGQKMQGMFRRE